MGSAFPVTAARWVLAMACSLAWAGGCGADDPPAEPTGPTCTPPAESSYSVQRDPLTQAPFHWPEASCVRWAVADTGVRDVADADLRLAVEAATAIWTGASCAVACFEAGGSAPPATFGYEPEADRQTTLLYWVDDEASWRARHSEAAIAITTVLSRPGTGEIVDADIELNAWGDHRWTLDPAAPSADVVSVVAHELGHVLGLGHDSEAAALMFGGWEDGWLSRALGASDLAGLCWLYACPSDDP